MTNRTPPRPDRVRNIGDDTFAFIPHRFLRDGFFASLTATERSLYLFLVLAADRRGVSFYGYDRICSTLEVTLETFLAARNALIDNDLIAFDGTRFQVLSLPQRPRVERQQSLVSSKQMEEHDSATIHSIIERSLDRDLHDK